MTTRHKVLIVDDEPQIRRLIHAALARADCATVEAANAREALDLLREERPDVVLPESKIMDQILRTMLVLGG